MIILLWAAAQGQSDKMVRVPGYDIGYTPETYAGLLNTSSPNKQLFYVFTESENEEKNPGSDPVTLWLNGGPGCSSLLGFIQEIGPYYLEDGVDYKLGDSLIRNNYSWAKVSNLLFIESPAGVGFSVNNQNKKGLNDSVTAEDLLAALLSWRAKYPAFANRSFWIAGQSYAGKYIPDIAMKIDIYNQQNPNTSFKLMGLLIGNGVMTFKDRSLEHSSIQYTMNHEFVPPDLEEIYRTACKHDPASAGCNYFFQRFNDITNRINPYNVYGYCYYNNSLVNQSDAKRYFKTQAQVLQKVAGSNTKYGAPCVYFDGMFKYFNMNEESFNAPLKAIWKGPCNDDVSGNYTKTEDGSMNQLRYLIFRGKYKIVLYNGDWDAVVPYIDTLKNIPDLYVSKVGAFTPWFVDNQHAGFYQNYTMNLRFVTFKGASHMVPQTKRAAAFQLFRSTISK